jgi:UDP-N-acetylglucosamine diphosphorylase / glucose-1-phosphate thymidylyltransferase / UDP-N-acetylgalactosamine diphosphorylase / glucosamine-1-phosphate N-acetyltransferase / galactosamine-1-phosphate N-acetyltransferase
MINIVIPMAGEGQRFKDAGYAKPKPFIDVNGKPMISRVIENLQYEDAHFYLLARKDHIEQEKALVDEISSMYKSTFIPIESLTEGTACTVLFARKYINNNNPLLIANSDQLVDIKMSNFIDDCFDRKLDGSILTFTDNEKNPKWSFAKTDDQGFVIEVKEKSPISNLATVGIYLFSAGAVFVDAAIDMIINNDRANNEFYTCPAYNYAIQSAKKIGVYTIKQEQMHGLGTPDDLDDYLN